MSSRVRAHVRPGAGGGCLLAGQLPARVWLPEVAAPLRGRAPQPAAGCCAARRACLPHLAPLLTPPFTHSPNHPSAGAFVPIGALTADDYEDTPEDHPSGRVPATAQQAQQAQQAAAADEAQPAAAQQQPAVAAVAVGKGAAQASLRSQPF